MRVDKGVIKGGGKLRKQRNMDGGEGRGQLMGGWWWG